MTSTEPRYQVYDRHNKTYVSAPYKCKRRATRRADKLDLEYGAIRYSVETIK